MSDFEIIYNGNKKIIKAESLWDAKKQAISCFKVPKSKQGLIAIQSLKSKEKEEFKYL